MPAGWRERTTPRTSRQISAVGGRPGCTARVSTFSPSRTVTAHFTRATGLYKGSSVRVLGVIVGKVTSIKPEGTTDQPVFPDVGHAGVNDGAWPNLDNLRSVRAGMNKQVFVSKS